MIMPLANYHSAELDQADLKNVQQLESELGVVLVAIEPDPQPASLSNEQLHRIRTLEQQTGKVLLAYSNS
jgi:hypothetical protein